MKNAEDFYQFKIVTSDTNESLSPHVPADCVQVTARFNIMSLVMTSFVSNEYIEDTRGESLLEAKKMLKNKLKEHLQAIISSMKDDGEDQGRLNANTGFLPFVTEEDD